MSNEFARRYGDAGLVSVSLNPGNMISYLHDRPLGWLERKIIVRPSSPLQYPVDADHLRAEPPPLPNTRWRADPALGRDDGRRSHNEWQGTPSFIHKALDLLLNIPTRICDMQYLKPWARYGRPNPIAEDNKATQELWKWCEDQVANI